MFQYVNQLNSSFIHDADVGFATWYLVLVERERRDGVGWTRTKSHNHCTCEYTLIYGTYQ